MEKKETIELFLQHNVVVASDVVDTLSSMDHDSLIAFLKRSDLVYLNKDILEKFLEKNISLNWRELEKAKALLEKTGDAKQYETFLKYVQEHPAPAGDLEVITTYEETSEKREVQDFTLYYNARLEALQKILYSREELKSSTSISRILQKRDRENVSCIGLVKEKGTTKNGNIMLTLEDSTGEIKVLVNKNKPDMFISAKDIVEDEVIGVSGVNGDKIVFANNVFWPDIPSMELKKGNTDGYAIFLSDIHAGSNNFLQNDFEKFLAWINGQTGNSRQKAIASKVKYIFIVGDLVDGVGIYPGQEDELIVKDVIEQYKLVAGLLLRIPSRIQLIICPGNHDALRLSEPQPAFNNEYCKPLMELPNALLLSNPCTVSIKADKGSSAYTVLLYHGYSFDYYVANVDTIRNSGGYDRADLIMKFLLKRRHLAPAHTSTLYVPYTNQDPLVISTVPDIFATGHIHKCAVSQYKGTTLICGSCWQSKTAFQEKMGHHPEPSRVPIVNLKTREVTVLRFGHD